MYKQFKKIKVTIDGKDITSFFTGIQIFQTLDSPTWSCQVNIMDASNLVNKLPILHGSKLDIEIETRDMIATDLSYKFEFYIYRVGDKSIDNQKMETYTLFAAPKAFLVNSTKRINKKYTNKKITEVISEVAQEFLGFSCNVPKPCDNNSEIVVNNWSPFITIGWLLKQSHKNKCADFMCFQTDNGKFSVKSIEDMYTDSANKVSPILKYRPANTDKETPYNILKHTWSHADVQQNLTSGFYKSTLVTYDFRNKDWAENIYSHGDDNSADKAVAPEWKDSLFSNAEKSVVSFMPKHTGMFENATSYDTSDIWLQSRRASLQRLDSEKLTLQIKGTVGTLNWLGKNIMVELPNQSDTEPNQPFDPKRKGSYLITAVTHWITPSSYINNIELVKRRLE